MRVIIIRDGSVYVQPHRRKALVRIGDIGLWCVFLGGFLSWSLAISVAPTMVHNHCGVRPAACLSIDADLTLWTAYSVGIGLTFAGFLLVGAVNEKLSRRTRRR